jgi:hypothetical protein
VAADRDTLRRYATWLNEALRREGEIAGAIKDATAEKNAEIAGKNAEIAGKNAEIAALKAQLKLLKDI